MKRLFNLLFKCILVTSVISPLVTIPASAIDTNSLVINVSCGNGFYSVDRITGYNQFTNLGCYPENKLADAFAAMKLAAVESPNVVIRNNASNSPLNIIAADRAMAYSQNATYIPPYSATMNVFKDKALTVPYTYINQENPLYYYATEIKSKSSTENISPSDLVVEIEINGARGYVPLNGVDIIPLIYVENRDNNWLISFTRRTVENTYYGTAIRPNITHYKVAPASFGTVSGDVNKRILKVFIDTAIYSYSLELGIAPDWLVNGTYYSADGIKFFTDMDLKNPVMNGSEVGRYYNYYQYLNLRSKTNYTGSELDAYYVYNGHNNKPSVLENQGKSFVNAQNTYGMNALLIYAMGIHESAYGTSAYAMNYKNLFGYGAYDDNPGNIANYSYASVEDCVNQQMGLNLRHYLDSSNFNAATNSSLFYASNIGNKGAGINTRYASDPWWSTKIASWAFKIDRYLGFKDFNNYQLGIIGDSERNLYKDSQNANTIYNISPRATNYPVVIHSSHDDTYYTYSTNPIASDGTIITGKTNGIIPYNWDKATVYIKKSQVTLANSSPKNITVISDTDNLIVYNSTLKWEDNNTLTLKGYSALGKTNMANVDVTHILRVVNLEDGTKTYDFNLAISSTPDFDLNLLNGYNYAKAWFEGNLDLSILPAGHYRFEVITKAGDTTGVSSFVNSDASAPLPKPTTIAGSNYRFVFNNTQKMRYELQIEKGLNYTSSNYSYPTRFYPVAFLNSYKIEEDKLKMDGLAYILGNPTGVNNEVKHQLLVLSPDGIQTLFDLETNTGLYDYSNGGTDYTYAWFKGKIDLDSLPSGAYKMYILTTSNGYTDAIELRDYINSTDVTVEGTTRNYSISSNTALKRRIQLSVTTK